MGSIKVIEKYWIIGDSLLGHSHCPLRLNLTIKKQNNIVQFL